MRFTSGELSRGGRIMAGVDHLKYLTMQNTKPLSPTSQRFYAREIRKRVGAKGRKCLVTMTVRVQMVNWHAEPDNGKFPRANFYVKSQGSRDDRMVHPHTRATVIRNRIMWPMIPRIADQIESWNQEGTDWTFEKFLSIHFELCWDNEVCENAAVHGSLEELPAELKSLKNVHITNRNGDGECLRLSVEVAMWWHLNPTATKLPGLIMKMGYPVHRTAAILREAGDQLDWTDVGGAWTTSLDIMKLQRNNEGLFIEVIDYIKGMKKVDGVEMHYPAISPMSHPQPTKAREARIHLQLLRIAVSQDVYHYVALGPGALGAIEVSGTDARQLLEASDVIEAWCGLGFKARELMSVPGLAIGQAARGR